MAKLIEQLKPEQINYLHLLLRYRDDSTHQQIVDEIVYSLDLQPGTARYIVKAEHANCAASLSYTFNPMNYKSVDYCKEINVPVHFINHTDALPF